MQEDFEKVKLKSEKSNLDEEDVETIFRNCDRINHLSTGDSWYDSNFLFEGSLSPRFAKDPWLMIHGRYDTGSDANWITKSILEDAGYDNLQAYRGKPYKSIDNKDVVPIGQIRVTWCDKTKKKNQTVFFVIESSQYDMIIGKGVLDNFAALAVAALPPGS